MNVRYERQPQVQPEFLVQTKIIWHKSEAESRFAYPKSSLCRFRKSFSLEKAPKTAKIRLFADCLYVLYVNGVQVSRSNALGEPFNKTFKSIDLTNLLNEGQNVISAEVLYFSGKSNGMPAFFAECEVEHEDGENIIISTDESWKVKLCDALLKDVPERSGNGELIEAWDYREDEEFYLIDFDDSSWDNAYSIDLALSPYFNLSEDKTPTIQESYVPARAVISGGIGKTAKGFEKSKLMEKLKAENDALTLSTLYVLETKGEFPITDKDEFNYIILDFEKIRNGHLSLELEGYSGDVVDVIYAKELKDGKPCIDNLTARHFSTFVLKDGYNKLETRFLSETFRYAMVIFRSHVRKLKLNRAGIMEQTILTENKSEFSAENKELQWLWDASVNTIYTCSVKDEETLTAADLRFFEIAKSYLKENKEEHENFLLKIARTQNYEGLVSSYNNDINKRPVLEYTLQWVNSFLDYYVVNNEAEIIEQLWNNIMLAMSYFQAFENKDGLLEDLPYDANCAAGETKNESASDFGRGGINGLTNLVYAEALDAVSVLAGVISDKKTAKYFKNKSKKLKKSYKKMLWNSEKGAYSDCMVSGIISDNISESVNAMALLMLHDPDDKRCSEIIRNVFDASTRISGVVKVNPCFMLPFYRAMKKMNRNDIAFSETLARYKNMLDAETTSMWGGWELFKEIDGKAVLSNPCSKTAVAPIVFIAENILFINTKVRKIKKPCASLSFGEYSAKIIMPYGTYNIEVTEEKIKKYTLE